MSGDRILKWMIEEGKDVSMFRLVNLTGPKQIFNVNIDRRNNFAFFGSSLNIFQFKEHLRNVSLPDWWFMLMEF